jgi:hypothetical protein
MCIGAGRFVQMHGRGKTTAVIASQLFIADSNNTSTHGIADIFAYVNYSIPVDIRVQQPS